MMECTRVSIYFTIIASRTYATQQHSIQHPTVTEQLIDTSDLYDAIQEITENNSVWFRKKYQVPESRYSAGNTQHFLRISLF